MRNLKRALCMALSAVMLLGMMVIASAATFTDGDTVVHTEAVDTMTALKIINGMPDGSFNPTGTVTRAQMAKMICIALNGGRDPQLGTTTTSYTDTVGNWAAGYIEYCTNLGIVAGRGNGIFDPNGTVTGTEAAKMLLVAIGYDASAEGFTGASWAINVNVRANQKDLFDELATLNPSAGLSRDNAAQMVYNAISALMVKYEYKLVAGTDGTLSTKAVAEDDTMSILEKKFDMTTEYGVITYVSYNSDKDEYTYTVTPDTDSTITSFTSDVDYSNLFMMDTKIMYKGDDTDNVYGVYANDSSVLVSGVVDVLPTIADTDTSFKYDGVTYKLGDDADAIEVYNFNVNTAVANKLNAYETAITEAYSFNLIDNTGDGKADLVVVYPFTVEQVSYVGANTFTTNTGSVDKDDVNYYTGMAKDDFVKVVAAVNTVDNKDTYTKVSTMTGTVSSTKTDGSFKLSGTWYKVSADPIVADTVTAGDKYEDIAVVNGFAFNIASAGSSIDASDYAVVLTATVGTDSINGAQVKLLLSDGTTVVVDAAANYTATGTNLINKLVTFDVDSDDVYTLTEATGTGFDRATTGTGYAYDDDGMSTIGDCYIDPNAVIFVDKDTTAGGYDWDVITGAELAKTNTATVFGTYAYANDNDSTGFGYVALACVQSDVISADTKYGYVTEAPEVVKNSDDDLVYSVTFWDGTKTVTAETTVAYNDASLAHLDEGTLITFAYDGSDIDVQDVTVLAAGNTAAVASYSNSKIAFQGVAGIYNITSDTVVIYVDAENTDGVAGGSIQLASDDGIGGKVKNVYYELDGSDVTLLVVDVQNDILDVQ